MDQISYPRMSDGQKVPGVHRGLIYQKVSLTYNLPQKVIPSVDWSKNSPFSTFSKRTLTAPCEYA